METKGSSARRWYLPACHQSQYVPTYLKSTWASVDAVPGQNGGRPGVAADKGDCPTPPSGTAAQSLRIRPGPGPGQQLLSCLQATLGTARIDGIQWAAQAAGCEYRDGTGTLWRCWPLPSCGRCHEVHWKSKCPCGHGPPLCWKAPRGGPGHEDGGRPFRPPSAGPGARKTAWPSRLCPLTSSRRSGLGGPSKRWWSPAPGPGAAPHLTAAEDEHGNPGRGRHRGRSRRRSRRGRGG